MTNRLTEWLATLRTHLLAIRLTNLQLIAAALSLLVVAAALVVIPLATRPPAPRSPARMPSTARAVTRAVDPPRVEVAAGTAEVRHAKARGWQPLRAGASLGAGDTLRTGPRSKVKVTHAGGVIWLFDRTVLRLPVEAGGDSRVVRRPELLRGQALFDADGSRIAALATRAGARTGKAFEVVTPHIVAGVKGTRFVVIEHGNASYVCVLAGSVATSSRTRAGQPTLQLVRWQVVDYRGGRLKATRSLAKPEDLARFVRREAGPFTQETLARDGWLTP